MASQLIDLWYSAQSLRARLDRLEARLAALLAPRGS